ncbi:sirohydrochlorin chelatase [Promicromonospora sp. NPDC019610]|uniref:sirohydrochlorin chelatase n=1 Tax=Promicromonospora sp. NPDC019610 TaxID=3364405 RepID=UPI00378C2A6B
MSATLIGTSHGTDDPAGQAAVRALLDGVRVARPGLDVREAFVDVQQPEVGDVLAAAVRAAATAGGASGADGAGADETGAGAPAPGESVAGRTGAADGVHEGSVGPDVVVVPLLLSTGYHVRHDIAQAVAAVNAAGAGTAVAADPLGPHPLLVDILADRYAAAEAAHGPFRPDDVVVLAAAGSSVAAAATAVEEVTSALAQRLGRPVTPSYGAGAEPRVPDAVAAARAAGLPGATAPARVIVVSYLLAPGYFLDRVLEAGADVVTDPVAGPAGAEKPDPRLVQVVLDRYDAAVSA